jgi:rhodanese-related sulfurtransferase
MHLRFKRNEPAKAREYFLNKLSFTTGPMEVDSMRRAEGKRGADFLIVDVRAPEDFEEGHVPGAINIPEDQWSEAIDSKRLNRDTLNVVYCYTQVCHLAARACLKFATEGFSVMEMEGGFESWKEHELDVERGASAQSAETTVRAQSGVIEGSEPGGIEPDIQGSSKETIEKELIWERERRKVA